MFEGLLEFLSYSSLKILVAELCMCYSLEKRKHFLLRIVSSAILFTTITYFLPREAMFAASLVGSFFVLWFSFDTPPVNLLYATFIGYSVYEAFLFLYMMTQYLRLPEPVDTIKDWIYYCLLMLMYVLNYFLFGKRLRYNASGTVSYVRTFSSALVLSIFYSLSFIWGAVFRGDVQSIVFLLLGIFVEMALFVLLHFFGANRLEQQNEITEQLLRKEQEHFELSCQNMDLVNIKCHDIKKNIEFLRKSSISAGEIDSYCEELNKIAEAYDNTIRTGCAALDVVLMEMKPIIDKNKINFTYMVNGEILEFINPIDAYSLFSNILRNAVQREIDEAEDRRFISIKINETAGKVYIHADNYCSSEIAFDNNLPATTKADHRLHGYGTKSICYIVKKYGGIVNFNYRNKRFNISVLIPIKR